MKKYWWLTVLLFSCKKHDVTPQVTTPVQPKRMAVYNVDIGTGTESFQYDIRYYYNDSTQRYDSIGIAGNSFRFDYSQISTANKVILNFGSNPAAFDEIDLDANFYTVTNYKEVRPSPDTTSTSTFEYTDSSKRLTKFTFDKPGTEHFVRSYTPHYDTLFIGYNENSGSCYSNDTTFASVYHLGTSLPWLFFMEPAAHCGSMGFNILRALPVSGYVHTLPARIINNDTEIVYSYFGDTYSRLAQVDIVFKSRATAAATQKLRIRISY